MTRTVQATDAQPGPWRGHAAVLALGTFAVGTDAFVIAGLLPEISDSLDVSVGAAGQLVSVFSLAYALLSPVLATLTSRWSRRSVLILALLVFAVGNVVTALAPDYTLVLISRVIAAAGAAMFTPNAGATAATLAGPEQRGRAIAIVTVGLTASLALGAPLGTAIGDALGWQATMWFVTALALLVAPVIALRLPEVSVGARAGLRQRLAPLTDRRVVGVLACTLIAFIGVYLPYTYISAVFEPATGGNSGRVAILLLVFGLAGTAGNLTAGRLADRKGPRKVVIGATLLLTVVFGLMAVAHSSYALAVVLSAVSGIGSWSVTAPQQQRIIAFAAPGTEPLVVSLNAAVMYLAISLSSVLGAGILGPGGPAHLAWTGAAFTVAAALITVLTGRFESGTSTAAAAAPRVGAQESPAK
ncbi:MFS transporter [Streptomyces eurocidicus]|uniref:MFS transporter n=1 Tax=Streptomyces eurocidicus TaxID=66423 RepID=A0A2N8P0L8_STREU|nr:MFS transporter [Streptomyces eurocidicus]MBB5122048.1 putative MFS family arabinose efflux permease [Streptomyces eurocidicus]MBF6055381.1 MFS transporter [Streptomyces eurocidicus]PNE34570.1 MFS transporter [Streptomyces eurocidicus]